MKSESAKSESAKFESATVSGTSTESQNRTATKNTSRPGPRIILVTILLVALSGGGFAVWRVLNPPVSGQAFAASIVCTYEAASKEEVEEAVTRRILNAIRQVEGIESVVTHSFEGDALFHIRGHSNDSSQELEAAFNESLSTLNLPQFADVPVVEIVEPDVKFINYKKYERVWLTVLKDEDEQQSFIENGPSAEALSVRESILKSIERRVVIELWRDNGMEIVVDVPPEYGFENLHIKHGEGVAQIRQIARVIYSESPIRTEYSF